MMAKADRLSGAQKAAIVMLALKEDAASYVFKEFSDLEIKRIGAAMTDVYRLPTDAIQEVLKEFDAVTSDEGLMLLADTDHLRRVASKVLGEGKANQLFAVLSRGGSMESGGLADADPRTLANLLRKEHPQTIAMLLAHTLPDKAGPIIAMLPENLQVEVMMRVSNLDTISPDLVRDIETVLEEEVVSLGSLGATKAGGVEVVAELFNQMERSAENRIMEGIEERNPELAERIRQLLFVFEDLVKVDDRGIQQILKEINNETLVLALKTATDEIKDKIYNNMSKRAAAMIQEDLEIMGPVRISDVERAQQMIIQVALKLEEEGRIIIGGGRGEEILV